MEYSPIVRQKLKNLRKDLTDKFGEEISRNVVKKITDAAKNLGTFPMKGLSVSAMFDVDCNYRYLYVEHNYLFYRIEPDKIIIVEIFNEREDFMWKLLGIDTTPQSTYDYWDE